MPSVDSIAIALLDILKPISRLSFLKWLRKPARFVFKEVMTISRFAEFRFRTRHETASFELNQFRQSMPQFVMPVNNINKYSDLVSLLQSTGIHYQEGRHAIYIPPQRGIHQLLGHVATAYPPDAG
jgi:hypothetical protein